MVIVGVVVAMSIFINPTLDFDHSPRPLNIYSLHCARMAELFRSFYENFEKVMSAQVIISGINTALTSAFVYATRFLMRRWLSFLLSCADSCR